MRTRVDEGTGCGDVSVSLPSLRVDAFTVGVAAQIQRARRTGLTFAPEAGTWRMRQVINKLITEEDLFAAVDSAFSQGWKRVKLYFLTGLPTETDEDTLGIIDLARRCVDLAKAKGLNGSVTVSVGGFVPKAFTPFQWFGMNTEEELRRKVGLLRDAAKGARNVNLKWHDPKASLIEGLVSRGDRRLGPVIEQVWRAGGTFQEWSEHFRLDLWQEAMADHGLEHRLVHATATAPRTRCCRGTTSPRGSTRTSSGRTGGTRSRSSASRTAAGRPATTAAPAPATASSTWWPRPSPPAGGSQGTGQGLAFGVPVELTPSQAGGGGRVRARLRFTKLGKLRFLSHRDLARIWERSLRRAERAGGLQRGLLAPAQAALRAGAVHRATRAWRSTSTSTWSTGPASSLPTSPGWSPTCLPIGIEAQIAAPIGPGTESLQQSVTSCRWELEVVGRSRPHWPRPWTAPSPPPSCPSWSSGRGRPSTSTPGPRSWRWSWPTSARRSSSTCPASHRSGRAR